MVNEIEKQSYKVKIAGLPLKLRSTHNQRTVDELIQVVNGKVTEVKSHNSQMSSQRLLMLTALHLAEDLLSIKRSMRLELGQLETHAKDILSDLESSTISQIE